MIVHVINFIPRISTDYVKVGVIVFPGSNCDRDMYHVLTDVFNLNTQYFLVDFFHARNTARLD